MAGDAPTSLGGATEFELQRAAVRQFRVLEPALIEGATVEFRKLDVAVCDGVVARDNSESPAGGIARIERNSHVVDPAYWALELDAPATVVAEVTDYDPVKHALTYPPGAKITFEFPSRKARGPVKLVWHDGGTAIPRPKDFPADEKVPGTGAILFGDKGMIVHGSHGAAGCHLLPEGLMEQYSGKNAPAESIPRVKGHAWDWIEAIRAGRPAGSNFDYGGPLTQVALLGLIAIRYPGQTLKWDDQAMRFTNSEAANRHLRASYRAGWRL